jgi:pullulanase
MKNIQYFTVFFAVLTIIGSCAHGAVSQTEELVPENVLRIHYQRTASDYDDMTLWAWNDIDWLMGDWPEGKEWTGSTEFGVYWDVPLADNPNNIGFLFVNASSGEKDGGDAADKVFDLKTGIRELWCIQDSEEIFTERPLPPIGENTLRIHYSRKEGDYENMTLWAWNDIAWMMGNWPEGKDWTGTSSYGVYWDVPLAENAGTIGFLFVNKETGVKDMGDDADKMLNLTSGIREVWCEEGSATVLTEIHKKIIVEY